MPRTSASTRITLSLVANLPDGEEVFDGTLKGFGVRRRGTSVAYFVLRRVRGRLRRITIGRHGSPWTPETARKRASDLLLEIGTGGDPIAREESEARSTVTVNQVLDEFEAEHFVRVKPNTRRAYLSVINVYLRPDLGRKLIAEVTRGEVSTLHAKWGKRQPTNANNVLQVLSKVMTFAEDKGYREEGKNPCRRVKRFRAVKRERYLDDAELKRLGDALREAMAEGENPYMIAAILFLLITGARKGEALNLRWNEVDMNRAMARLPDSKTGPKVLPLSPSAVALLQGLPRVQGNPYVFVGVEDGRPLSTVQHVWETVRSKANLPDVRLHDLRHSFASFAGDAGGSLAQVGRILGHTDPRTTSRYVHFFEATGQALAGKVGERVAAAVGEVAPPQPLLASTTQVRVEQATPVGRKAKQS